MALVDLDPSCQKDTKEEYIQPQQTKQQLKPYLYVLHRGRTVLYCVEGVLRRSKTAVLDAELS